MTQILLINPKPFSTFFGTTQKPKILLVTASGNAYVIKTKHTGSVLLDLNLYILFSGFL